jgi:molybdate transport system substrate-binding protein
MTGLAKRAGSQAFLLAVLLLAASTSFGAEIHVMISGGFSAAYRALTPKFESATHHTLVTVGGPSMGETPQAIPNRLKRGEPADVVILVSYAVDGLMQQGLAVPGSRVDLANTVIALAVRKGAPKPDIGTVEAFKRTLLAAKSIAYSDSASGVYLSTDLFPRLGIADALKGKARMIPAEPVGQVVARGEAEIGMQQVSEMLPVPGIDIVGPIPRELQKITVFSAALGAHAKEPEAGKALIRFLTSPEAAAAIKASGMEPGGAK